MLLKSIGQETQIEDCILGQSNTDKESLQMKIDFTTKNISSVISINGKKVFHAIVNGEDICYNLSEAPKAFPVTDKTERQYYYPIQYANIMFFNNNL